MDCGWILTPHKPENVFQLLFFSCLQEYKLCGRFVSYSRCVWPKTETPLFDVIKYTRTTEVLIEMVLVLKGIGVGKPTHTHRLLFNHPLVYSSVEPYADCIPATLAWTA